MDVIIHIPHDGHIFSEDLKQFILISDIQLKKYHSEMSDLYLNHIASHWLDCPIVSFPISRLFCDVERFLNNEPMEQYGMGFCYTHMYDGLHFKNNSAEVQRITRKYYDEHHEKLNNIANSIIEPTLLIDLHSFNPRATRKELLNHDKLPDICIGYDFEHCESAIIQKAIQIFKQAGYSVQENYPYKGSFIPSNIINGKIKPPLQSIMIEINRDCYIDKSGFEIPKECNKLGRMLALFSGDIKTF